MYPVSVGFGDLLSELRENVTLNETSSSTHKVSVEEVSRALGLSESFPWHETCAKWYPVFGSEGNASTTAEGAPSHIADIASCHKMYAEQGGHSIASPLAFQL